MHATKRCGTAWRVHPRNFSNTLSIPRYATMRGPYGGTANAKCRGRRSDDARNQRGSQPQPTRSSHTPKRAAGLHPHCHRGTFHRNLRLVFAGNAHPHVLALFQRGARSCLGWRRALGARGVVCIFPLDQLDVQRLAGRHAQGRCVELCAILGSVGVHCSHACPAIDGRGNGGGNHPCVSRDQGRRAWPLLSNGAPRIDCIRRNAPAVDRHRSARRGRHRPASRRSTLLRHTASG